MAFMARAAELAGAGAIRASGPRDIAAIKQAVDIPVIGLLKRRVPGSPVYITPGIDEARVVARAGADLIAIDGTLRSRPDGIATAASIRCVVDELGLPVMADIDCLAAARVACDSGAAFVATTLAGYTSDEPADDGPDIGLVRALPGTVACPVIAEGRYRDPSHVADAFRAGAHAVVVGRAITDPFGLALAFVAATPSHSEA
jgi:N-acylglucosamine-6-phosphate 2-epimerase